MKHLALMLLLVAQPLWADEATSTLINELIKRATQAESIAVGQEAATEAKADAEEKKSQRHQRSVEPRKNDPSIARRPKALLTGSDQTNGALETLLKRYADSSDLERKLLDHIAERPNDREARLILARHQTMSAQPLEALDTLEPLRSSHHADWRPWFWGATAHLALGNTEAARDALDIALAKNPRAASAWNQMGVIEQETGHHEVALQYLEIAAELEPQMARAHLNQAYSLEHLQRYGEALAAYRRYLSSPQQGVELRAKVMRHVTALVVAQNHHPRSGETSVQRSLTR